MQQSLFIVISAPSGAGKSTLCDRLLEDFSDITYSVSCTTRPPRGKENDGEDYYFISDEGFRKRVKEGAFIEHAVVHGYCYGTLKSTVIEAMNEGQSVLMDIDVEGARQIRSYIAGADVSDPIQKGFIDIFIQPPSLDALRERLIGRMEDSEDVIEARLDSAEQEIRAASEYRYRIVNDDLEVAYRALCEILIAAGSQKIR